MVMTLPHFAATVDLKINGSEVASDQALRLSEVSVEQSLHLPSMCLIWLHDVGTDPTTATFFDMLDQDVFSIGAELELGLGRDEDPETVFSGEITAVELEAVNNQTPRILVRAYDRSHRLHRGLHSRSFVNMSDSDIVAKIAQEVGLSASSDSTDTVHDYVFQYNLSNWEFLRQRAARNGFECYVDGRTLHFARPRNGQQLGPDQRLWDNLLDVHIKMTSSFQASSVVVRAWDIKAKQAIVGTASSGSMAPKIGESRTGQAIAADFGDATVYTVNQPLDSQSEANTLASALYDDLDGTFVEADGTCLGDASLKAGMTVKFPTLGERLSGEYYLTSVVHTVRSDATYTTSFVISGRRSQSLYDVIHSSDSGSGLPNAVVGLVTNNTDPDGMGRVKVKFPWLDDSEESWWARPATPMAGASRGMFFLPEVNDEVLVAFEHGDITRPFILGGLWNGQDAPPKTNTEVVGSSKVNERILKTRAGHTISLDDTEGSEKITISDKTDNN
jgi:phage protein D